jgi:hypothetical protein
MDFTSQPDREYNWVLQIKDHFSRMIWLFPLKEKSSPEVARALTTWIQPYRFYCDNGSEFKGDVDDLWFVGTLLLRLYVGVHTTLKPRVVLRSQ